MKKDLGIIGGLFLLIILLATVGRAFSSFGFLNNQGSSSSLLDLNIFEKKEMKVIPLTVRDLAIDTQVAATPDERKKGLSGRESLPINSGMLFVFDSAANWGIWMKDMQFPIDIIWINADRKIVYIVQNATPQPGKKDSELAIYRSNSTALYVLEVNAGISNLHNLQVGDTANFNLSAVASPKP